MFAQRSSSVLMMLAVALVAALAQGCGKGGSTVELEQMGFSMKLPAGWRQGEPLAGGGYRPYSEGVFFFESADKNDPSGDVMEMPLEGASLTEYVEKLIKEAEAMGRLHVGMLKALDKVSGGAVGEEQMKEIESSAQSRVTSKRQLTVSGLEAVEVATEAPRSNIQLYVRRGDKLIVVTFGALREEFPKYEPLFREAIGTIEIR